MNDKLLKITRYRSVMNYFYKIEFFSMNQGNSCVKFDSLRWKRLQLCVDSIEYHVLKELHLFGVYC